MGWATLSTKAGMKLKSASHKYDNVLSDGSVTAHVNAILNNQGRLFVKESTDILYDFYNFFFFMDRRFRRNDAFYGTRMILGIQLDFLLSFTCPSQLLS